MQAAAGHAGADVLSCFGCTACIQCCVSGYSISHGRSGAMPRPCELVAPLISWCCQRHDGHDLQANLGTAHLLVQALQQQGLSAKAAKSRIWMVDSKGIILKTRQNLTSEKAVFAQDPYRLAGGVASAEALEVTSSTDGQHSNGAGSGSSRDTSDQDVAEYLAKVVSAVQPTALIGAAAVAGAFGQSVIEALLQVSNHDPTGRCRTYSTCQ